MPLAEFLDPPPRPRCEAGTVDLWLVDLEGVARRDLSAAAREALLEVLGRYLRREPGEIELETRAGGKPRLALPGGPSFNLSHTGGLALIAVSAEEVGVDVERVDPSRNIEGVARWAFGADVAAELSRLPERARATAFYARWTAHEARAKLTGEGIGGVRRGHSGDVTVRPVAVAEGYAAAVAARGDRWSIRGWTFRPEGGVKP
jgi:phosphopantetheinyl transferase